jgi:phosphoribosyl-AMP cyclohydrolase / phosphoribosyl-ATP pyrophosphohydrolase
MAQIASAAMGELDFAKMDGLIPAIVQDADSGQILMLGFMSPEALVATREKGLVTFWSRARNELWTKGDTSGNRLELVSLHADCDGDAILVKARPTGPACHTGEVSCFFVDITEG